MSEPSKTPSEAPKPSLTEKQWEEAFKHLDKVEAEVKALALDDKGQPKVGCNAFHYIRSVTHPLRVKASNEVTRGTALYAEILALKSEEPLVSKFFTNPINGKKGVTIAVSLPPEAPKANP